MLIMKIQKNQKPKKPIHLHIEHISRARAVLVVIAGFMTLAISRSDSKIIAMMREAYTYSYGRVGTYMREETVRESLLLPHPKTHTISGK